ncbi:hypothetical protein HDU86_006310 [Geranomyces michiganensis]|nr:hypothetical protein HDU86_006310 [Geranomyces michiganensis]
MLSSIDPAVCEVRSVALAGGLRVALAESGDPHGVPLFMLTGAGGCRLLVLSLHVAAKEHGIRLLIADKPGVGLSDDFFKPQTGTFDNVADMIVAVADQLKIDRFSVLGFSIGALDALALVHRHPRRILPSPLQLFNPWILPDRPNAARTIKIGRNLPEAVIRSAVMAGNALGGDPRFSWLGHTV